jgi:hypothetical protein
MFRSFDHPQAGIHSTEKPTSAVIEPFVLLTYICIGWSLADKAPHKDKKQISENNLRTESNIWSQVPEWARYLDIVDVFLDGCKILITTL